MPELIPRATISTVIRDKHEMPECGLAGLMQKGIKQRTCLIRTESLELPARCLDDIGHRPAGDDAKEAEDQKGGQQTHPAETLPGWRRAALGGQLAHGIRRAHATAAADHHLAHHDRHRDDKHRDQIDGHKRTAAGRTKRVGEFPDIAKTDRGADGCHQEGQPGRPALVL